MRVTAEILPELRKEIAYKWKVQTAKHWGCECVAYIDARQVMDLLDEVVGPQNWQDHYREVAGKVYCDLTIQVEDEWITKSDCGTASNFEADKGQASDAFKRAAVKWGIGRFLYQLSTIRTKSIEVGKDDRGNPRFFPADEQGQRIYNLTGYIHNLQKSKRPAENKTTSSKSGQPEKKAQFTPMPAPEKVGPPQPAPEEATQPQRDEIRMLCESLGWSGTEFSKYLQAKKLSWKHLQSSQAARLINELESHLPSDIKAAAEDDMALLNTWDYLQGFCLKFSDKLRQREEFQTALKILGGNNSELLWSKDVALEDVRKIGGQRIKDCYHALKTFNETLKQKQGA